jgi:hypothetical protein
MRLPGTAVLCMATLQVLQGLALYLTVSRQILSASSKEALTDAKKIRIRQRLFTRSSSKSLFSPLIPWI